MKNILKLIGCILICQSAGIIGSVFSAKSTQTWYPVLKKPSFTPPSWVFAPVWTTLYTLMGISLYLIIKTPAERRLKIMALATFALQLIANASWTVVFFKFKSIRGGLILICLLISLILLSIIYFARINKTAAWLLAPYLSWTGYATALNYKLLELNTN